MKKILITGANSYIGTSFEKFIKKNAPNEYIIDTIDMVGDSWKQKDFSTYDTVFHVAGIAHQKETADNAHIYYKINRDLVFEVANKSRHEGVRQFVFMSSMSVYGCEEGIISKNTTPAPKSCYGASKYEAELMLRDIEGEKFKVCIIRPPMVYGNGCKGNFNVVCKMVNRIPVFPYVKNHRSMIYVDNLSAFVKMVIDKEISGTYMPQNKEYTQTSNMASIIANALGKRLYMSRFLGCLVVLSKPFLSLSRKAFGTLKYEDVEAFDFSYCVVGMVDSYILSVCDKED